MKRGVFALESCIFHALAHPKRVEIVHLLSEKQLSVQEIVSMVGISQANVSQHLMLLRRLGLVRSHIQKQQRIYELSSPSVSKLSTAVRHILLERTGLHEETHLNALHIHQDPVCKMQISAQMAASSSVYEGKRYYFCASGCEKRFKKNPAFYSEKEAVSAVTSTI